MGFLAHGLLKKRDIMKEKSIQQKGIELADFYLVMAEDIANKDNLLEELYLIIHSINENNECYHMHEAWRQKVEIKYNEMKTKESKGCQLGVTTIDYSFEYLLECFNDDCRNLMVSRFSLPENIIKQIKDYYEEIKNVSICNYCGEKFTSKRDKSGAIAECCSIECQKELLENGGFGKNISPEEKAKFLKEKRNFLKRKK